MEKVPSQQDFALLNLITISLFKMIILDFSEHKSINSCNNEQIQRCFSLLPFLALSEHIFH